MKPCHHVLSTDAATPSTRQPTVWFAFLPLSYRECSQASTLAPSAMASHTVASGSNSKGKQKEKRNAVADIALEVSVLGLNVTKEAAGALPPLQATAAGLLVIVETISVRHSRRTIRKPDSRCWYRCAPRNISQIKKILPISTATPTS